MPGPDEIGSLKGEALNRSLEGRRLDSNFLHFYSKLSYSCYLLLYCRSLLGLVPSDRGIVVTTCRPKTLDTELF